MECPVCFCSLAEEGRVPKVLPCGHTFCSRCTDRLAHASGARGSRRLTCPQCRVECEEAEITTNFALRDLLQNSATESRATTGLREPLLVSEQRLPQAAAPAPSHGGLLPTAPPAPSLPGGLVPTAPPAPSQASDQQLPRAASAQALAPPTQAMMGGRHPWAVGPQNIYDAQGTQDLHFAPPQHSPEEVEWKQQRKATLLDWGKRRENFVHRQPQFLMDQMVSGSGFYPIRMLEDSWLLPQELSMVEKLQDLLTGTGNALQLARDMLTPVIYDVDVRIVLDNSGSMQLDMFGQPVTGYLSAGASTSSWIDQTGLENPQLMRNLFATMRTYGAGSLAVAPPSSPLSPNHRRWFFARDALARWMQVYSILGIDPWVYMLNPVRAGMKVQGSQLRSVFQEMPQGSTPMTEAIEAALGDHVLECPARPLLLLVVTDGEANNMQTFNAVLDRVQNNMYGDAQVCFMGLSLVPEDIEWFENEECDETRIRTVEAYEVEQRQIQLREVIKKEGAYNFEMHTYRVLLTNFYPADYDYEAPLQNLRHRLYITLHGRDRWYGLNNPCWRCLVSNILCGACFLATGAHCCGWCQGSECGKYQIPEILEPLFKGEE